MLSNFPRTLSDPLTGRAVSDACWNGHHEDSSDSSYDYLFDCRIAKCKCLCHEADGAKPLEKRDA